jgi:hypothetical protein
VQTYYVSGSNLTGNISIDPPAGFEVSSDAGVTWHGNGNPLSLIPAAGTVSATSISVRLNAPAAGNFSGDIVHSSAGAANVLLAVNGTVIAAPQIIVAGSLNPFTQTLGSPSTVQTYTVSGLALTADIIIRPPAGYEVSIDGTNWISNANTVTLTQSGGTVTATTISIRLNAGTSGNYAGNIQHTSTGANAVNLSVSGNVVPPPVVSSTGTLNAFSQTVGNPSAVQTYSVNGTNLTGNLTITPPVNYQVSSNGTTWYSNTAPLVLIPSAGTVSSTISVRLNATVPGTYAGNISHTSTGAQNISIAVNGVTVAAPAITIAGSLAAFAQTIGSPSPTQVYTITATNLTGPVQITLPAGFEASSNGGTNWVTGPLTLNPVSGTVSATTISVRLNAVSAGSFSGNIVHTTPGGANVNLAVSGTAVLPPTITVTASLNQFVQEIGTASPVQTYSVKASGLTGNLVLTPPAHYEISLNGFNWYATAITIAPVNGTVAATTVSVRLNAFITGPYQGALTHTSTGATSQNIQLNGFTKAKGSYVIYPVPAHHVLFISHPAFNTEAVMHIYSSTGQKLGSYVVNANGFETRLELEKMNAGLYFIELLHDNERTLLRFIKE